MNTNIIEEISKNLGIKVGQVEAVLKLLEDGNTIPFIARYRKEATGALNEEIIRKINEVYEYQVNLLKKKEDVIRLIDEKGLLTDELKSKILAAEKLVEVEDLYRPYKEKKKTKATDAIANGLEPLAKMMMSFPEKGSLEELGKRFINDKVKSSEDAISGAKYIIAEWVSDNASYRKWIRYTTFGNGTISSKLKKGAVDENKIFEMYYGYEEVIKHVKPHRVLALNRGEKLGILDVSINMDSAVILDYLEKKIIKKDSFVNDEIKSAISDSYKRLIKGSIEREIRSELTEKAEVVAIDNFAKNLEHLLLTPPMKDKMVLGFDPAFRTGCKLAVIDHTGKMLEIAVIYPHEPKNDYEGSKKIVLDLINKYNIDIVAIGNGTASRESEAFIARVLKEGGCNTKYVIVSEAGASVYSASKLAISEFPDLTVEKRSAISIGRRLQDPLAELVKIDPESIGVGLYQHDVSDKELKSSLDFIVEKTVNQVGVNVNTASSSLLEHISGLTKKNIEKIIDYRNSNGRIESREEIKKKKLLGDKAYEQSIGFLRIQDGSNILDETDIHPESYGIALVIMKKLGINADEIGKESVSTKISGVNSEELAKEVNCDEYTVDDILKSFVKPHRDPRDDMPQPLLKSDVLSINDLKKGMKLQGTVRNVVDFGAFVDIGLHSDGLIHISKMSKEYIKHPSDILSVGDIIDVYVDDINVEKEKVSLSLLEN